MRFHALVFVAGGLLFAADTDKEKLQGTWRAVSAERSGQAMKKADQHSLNFDGENFAIKRAGQIMLKGTFKLDSTKSPKTIDMTPDDGPQKGQPSQGIYLLDGDNLKWCSAEPGKDDRPVEFATNTDTSYMLVIFKKEKP